MALGPVIESFMWGPGGQKMSPEQIARQREMAARALSKIDTSPVGHWTQGAARMLETLGGVVRERRAGRAEADNAAFSADLMRGILGSQAFPAAPSASNTGADPSASPLNSATPTTAGGTYAPTSSGASVGSWDPTSVNPSVRDGIVQTASALGIDPVDLATAISYETGGTFDPTKSGPRTQWGRHRGLIQFGEPQAKRYGVNWDDPVGSQLGPNGAVANYLRDTGVQPGMGLLDIYSAINAGGVGRYNRSDANNGGAPGTVRDKVEKQMGGHRAKAAALIGGGGAPAPAAAPPGPLPLLDDYFDARFGGPPAPMQDVPPVSANAGPPAGQALAQEPRPTPSIFMGDTQTLSPTPPQDVLTPSAEATFDTPEQAQQFIDGGDPMQMIPAAYAAAPEVTAAISQQGDNPGIPMPPPEVVQQLTGGGANPDLPMAGNTAAAGNFASMTPEMRNMLVQALSDPRASDAARQTAMLFMRQQMEQQEAARQQAMAQQQAAAELAQREQVAQQLGINPTFAADPEAWKTGLRNLPGPSDQLARERFDWDRQNANRTGDINEYEYYAQQAREAGQQPLPFDQWDMARRRSGATNIDNRQLGSIPPGYRVEYDENGNPAAMAPIEGSPAAREIEEAERKTDMREGQQAITSDTVINAARLARDAIDSATLPATGTFSSTIADWLPESNAAEVRAQVNALQAVAASENINAMRQASPSGGALGNASDADIKLLKDKAGALNPGAGPERFKQQLDDYERTLLRIVHGPEVGDAIFKATRSPVIPPGAADMLRADPSLAPQFDAKYGPGAAARVLGDP